MGKGIFFSSASILLAVIITATLRNHHNHQLPPSSSFTDLTTNASQLIRSNGFNFIATFLHISPDLFLSTPETTIFAIPDAAISNLSIPPYMIKHLFAYHTSPQKLPIQYLFTKPTKTCLPTLIQHQKLSITKKDNKHHLLEINNVLITHPNLFLQGPIIIHGVAAPFASFDHNQETITLPVCDSILVGEFVKNKKEWGRVVKFLSSSGFMPFAIGLNSVVHGIMKDFPDLDSVTIFTPPNVALMAMSSLLLDKFMRFHIVPLRHSIEQLAGMPAGASLTTLVKGKDVDITETGRFSQVVFVNGVAITAPDLFSSENFIVHGTWTSFLGVSIDAAREGGLPMWCSGTDYRYHIKGSRSGVVFFQMNTKKEKDPGEKRIAYVVSREARARPHPLGSDNMGGGHVIGTVHPKSKT